MKYKYFSLNFKLSDIHHMAIDTEDNYILHTWNKSINIRYYVFSTNNFDIDLKK